MEQSNTPYLWVEVNDKSSIHSLAKRFDDLFPGSVIRLVINGKYSPFFYLGQNSWAFKPSAPAKKRQYLTVQFKVYFDEHIKDFLDPDQILLLNHLNIDLDKLKFASDLLLKHKECPGIFFTDGYNIVLDQYLIDNTEKIINCFADYFLTEKIIDLSNDKETGLIVLKSKRNIFGVKNNDICY